MFLKTGHIFGVFGAKKLVCISIVIGRNQAKLCGRSFCQTVVLFDRSDDGKLGLGCVRAGIAVRAPCSGRTHGSLIVPLCNGISSYWPDDKSFGGFS